MDLTLPLDHAAIERILPHRYPFLLVDRIIEFEVDKRIVGIKNISLNDPYLSHGAAGDAPGLPPSILTEGIAQVGAILILAKPENRQRVPLLTGIQRVRYHRAAQSGDVVVFEVVVVRLRRRMGVFKGFARVDHRILVEGTMTFALASARGARSTLEGADPAGTGHYQ
jgi:3-hydroxyacyl-[acyl-carrier-protein] dehydratase